VGFRPRSVGVPSGQMEALARLREGVNRAGTVANGESTAGREAAIDWFWALLSFGLALGMFASGGLGPTEHDQRGLDGLGFLIAAGMSLPLLARRRAPVAVFLVVMASLVALASLRYPPDVTIGPAVALFTLARAAGRDVPFRLAVALGIGCFLAVAVALTVAYSDFFVAEIGFTGLVWLAIWFGGRGSRLKQERISWLEERAERAEHEAERERRLAAAEERTRIARDLHDSAGHAINVILVEAGAARLLRERDPERAEQALETIEEVAREQIGEIDRLVHALRSDDPDDQVIEDCVMPGGIPTGPAAGEALFERMRASGLDLDVEWHGERRRLGPRVGRASFRILQEALTNAVRHGTGSARVRVHFGDHQVEFMVDNPIDGDEPGHEGFGLTGMRERVGLLGGRLDVAQEDGRFRVRAVLPYDRTFDPRTHGHEPAEPAEPERR
jgi:signal transduction histidine kinase